MNHSQEEEKMVYKNLKNSIFYGYLLKYHYTHIHHLIFCLPPLKVTFIMLLYSLVLILDHKKVSCLLIWANLHTLKWYFYFLTFSPKTLKLKIDILLWTIYNDKTLFCKHILFEPPAGNCVNYVQYPTMHNWPLLSN